MTKKEAEEVAKLIDGLVLWYGMQRDAATASPYDAKSRRVCEEAYADYRQKLIDRGIPVY